MQKNTKRKVISKIFNQTLLIGFFLTGFLGNSYVNGQSKETNQHFWTDESGAAAQEKTGFQINSKSARVLNLDIENFYSYLNTVKSGKINNLKATGKILSLPMPDGRFSRFHVIESSIFDEKLAQKYPQIKTYTGQGLDDPTATARFDVTPKGFHAIIFNLENTVYIDPASGNSNKKYISYYKKDFIKKDIQLSPANDVIGKPSKPLKSVAQETTKQVSLKSSGAELRTYRLAVAATGEYTAFHGGTVPDGLAAIATSINRINGIFEREVAVTFILVANNDQIIYTNSTTDPYTNNDTDLLLSENQTNVDIVIGTANYDIGHVFSTASGGLAVLESVCNSSLKAKGTTGIASPVGDPFDVDFVAHEIGHQFGANHSFNGTSGSCAGATRSATTAYEPGSGTTIMGYAGICSPQNIQNNSNDYFHTASYDQIVTFTTVNAGNSCAAVTATGNNPPTVNAGSDYTIPISTPFTLVGTGNDPDGDAITFCWEQFDLGAASAPNISTSLGPLFRSFAPVTENDRTFPQLNDILSNTPTLGEILPSTDRTMNFRLTIRDNRAGGSGVDYDNMSVTVVDLGGSFQLTALNTAETVIATTPKSITWQVANTNTAPVSTANVNILLSTDGGLTFPTILAASVPNDGEETVIFPSTATTTARIKIEAVGNIFFDINDTDFTIEVPTVPGFLLTVNPVSLTVCSPDDAIFNIDVISILGFSDDVNLSLINLPAGLTTSYSANPVTPGNTSVLTLSNTDLANPGPYTIGIVGTSGALTDQVDVTLNILSGVPFGPILSAPVDQQIGISLMPQLSWGVDPQVDTYTFELASDVNFTNILESASNIAGENYTVINRLEGNTTYYWRVRGTNQCGEGANSAVFSFITLLINYFDFASTNVPITISDGAPPNTSVSTVEINIIDDLIISDINVINLKGNHSFLSDLTLTLISPGGTEVILFSKICSNLENFDLNLDDDATTSIPCPATDGGTHQPSGNLSTFNNENARGIWTLRIEDDAEFDGGSLNSWGLDIGTADSRPKPPAALSATGTSITTINVTWQDNSNNETNFILERSGPDNSNFQLIGTLAPNTVEFDDVGLGLETTYFYRLKAVNSVGETAYTLEVESGTLPASPDNLSATTISYDQIDLSWVDNAASESSYVIEQSIGTNGNFQLVAMLAPNIESFSLVNLQEETVYYYRVHAKNLYGNSSYSVEQSATTLILGVNDELENNLSLFPNPTNGKVGITFENLSLNVEKINLIDIQGKTVSPIPVPKNLVRSKKLIIDLANKNQGIYLLEIYTDKGKVIKRIIKE